MGQAGDTKPGESQHQPVIAKGRKKRWVKRRGGLSGSVEFPRKIALGRFHEVLLQLELGQHVFIVSNVFLPRQLEFSRQRFRALWQIEIVAICKAN